MGHRCKTFGPKREACGPRWFPKVSLPRWQAELSGATSPLSPRLTLPCWHAACSVPTPPCQTCTISLVCLSPKVRRESA